MRREIVQLHWLGVFRKPCIVRYRKMGRIVGCQGIKILIGKPDQFLFAK